MSNLKTTFKTVVEQEVIKNLLSAHRRIAEGGSAADLLRITRFLLRLAKQHGEIMVDVIPESNQ